MKVPNRSDIEIHEFDYPRYNAMWNGGCIAQADDRQLLERKIEEFIAHRIDVANNPNHYVLVNSMCATQFYVRKSELGKLYASRYDIPEGWHVDATGLPYDDVVTIEGVRFETKAEAEAWIAGFSFQQEGDNNGED